MLQAALLWDLSSQEELGRDLDGEAFAPWPRELQPRAPRLQPPPQQQQQQQQHQQQQQQRYRQQHQQQQSQQHMQQQQQPVKRQQATLVQRVFPEIPAASQVPVALRTVVEARRESHRRAAAIMREEPDFARFAALQKEAHPILLEPIAKPLPGAAYRDKPPRRKPVTNVVRRPIRSNPIIFAEIP
jgi:hypothetical protein